MNGQETKTGTLDEHVRILRIKKENSGNLAGNNNGKDFAMQRMYKELTKKEADSLRNAFSKIHPDLSVQIGDLFDQQIIHIGYRLSDFANQKNLRFNETAPLAVNLAHFAEQNVFLIRNLILGVYLDERIDPAPIETYKTWLKGYLLMGNEPTRFVKKPKFDIFGDEGNMLFRHERFFVARKNMILAQLEEPLVADRYKIIVPIRNEKGSEITIDNFPTKGFELYFMDGFRYVGESKDSPADVPFFNWIKFGDKVKFDSKALQK